MAATPGITLGFIGTGEIKPKTTRSLLADLIEAAEGNARFLIPVTKDLWNDGLATVVAYAEAQQIPYEVITDESTATLKGSAPEAVEGALKSHKVARPVAKLVGTLAKAPQPTLIVLWDDEDDTLFTAAELAIEEHIPVLDLTSGLDEVELAEEEDGEEASEPADDEEEAPGLPESDDDEEVAPAPPSDDGVAPEGEEDDLDSFLWKEEELALKDVEELKAIAKSMGIELPPRTRANTYRKAILGQHESQATATGEVLDADAATIPADDGGEEIEIPADDDESGTAKAPVVGSTATTSAQPSSWNLVSQISGAQPSNGAAGAGGEPLVILRGNLKITIETV